MSTDIHLTLAAPDVDEYCALRLESGLSAMNREAAVVGLLGSWAAVCLRDGDELIGMGRVVGDGGLFFQIVDIAVKPALQGRGLGKRIMQSLMDELWHRAPAGAVVTLLADGEAHRLYRQFGFLPSAPASQGMLLRLHKKS